MSFSNVPAGFSGTACSARMSFKYTDLLTTYAHYGRLQNHRHRQATYKQFTLDKWTSCSGTTTSQCIHNEHPEAATARCMRSKSLGGTGEELGMSTTSNNK